MTAPRWKITVEDAYGFWAQHEYELGQSYLAQAIDKIDRMIATAIKKDVDQLTAVKAECDSYIAGELGKIAKTEATVAKCKTRPLDAYLAKIEAIRSGKATAN